MRILPCLMLIALLCRPAHADTILFDFNNTPIHTPLPLDLTFSGVTAHFSATGQGMSIQDPTQSIGLLPAGFGDLCISPNSVFAADLIVDFPQTMLSSFSILYAPQELATDSSATMRVTAFENGTFVGTNTYQVPASQAGTWPTGTLSISSAQGFNHIVVHYDSPPPASQTRGHRPGGSHTTGPAARGGRPRLL